MMYFKSMNIDNCALQVLENQNSVSRANLEPETMSKTSFLIIKDWTAAARCSKYSFLMLINVAFLLEIKVPECGGRLEKPGIPAA